MLIYGFLFRAIKRIVCIATVKFLLWVGARAFIFMLWVLLAVSIFLNAPLLMLVLAVIALLLLSYAFEYVVEPVEPHYKVLYFLLKLDKL